MTLLVKIGGKFSCSNTFEMFGNLLTSGTVQDYDNLPVEFNGFCPVALLSGGEYFLK
jgi:hypothetical protein